MLIRYLSIFIRVITILMYPFTYGTKGIYSISIVGYLLTFLFVPIESFNQFDVYNDLKNNKKYEDPNDLIFMSFTVFLLFIITIIYSKDLDLIFSKLDIFAILSTAFLCKYNTRGYFKARNNNHTINKHTIDSTSTKFQISCSLLFTIHLIL